MINQPRFPHTLWSKYDAIVKDEFMTSNTAERYNYGLPSALTANPGTWTLIATLKSEKASANLKLKKCNTRTTKY